MGAMGVGPQARREYLARMRERYETADRATKSRLLNEVCDGRSPESGDSPVPPARGAPAETAGTAGPYGPVVAGTLRRIWEAAGYPWSLRLRALLPTWLPWATRRWQISHAVAGHLRTMSPRQMDRCRCLRPFKTALRKRQYGRTKPGPCSSIRFR
jgi:hypothetical protein